MTNKETEKMILDRAEDFAFLLADQHAIARLGPYLLFPSHPGEARWFARDNTGTHHIPAEIAIAALIEFWRDRLEKKHGMRFYHTEQPGHQVMPYRKNAEGSFVSMTMVCDSLPEGICAAAHVLAEERRKAQKPTPSPAAVRAANRIVNTPAPVLPLAPGHTAEVYAAIIDQEFAKEQRT